MNAGEYERLGGLPTPDVEYSEQGRQVGKHLIDVHDHLRAELTELRSVVAQVRDGARTAGDARDALNRV